MSHLRETCELCGALLGDGDDPKRCATCVSLAPAYCSESQYVHVLSFNGEVKGFTTDRLWAHEWAAQLDGRGVDTFVPKIGPQNSGFNEPPA